MTPVRAGVVLFVGCAICLVVVMLRAERVRLDARAEAHLSKLIEARRRTWNLQAELARLRAPEEVRRRARRVEPGLCGAPAKPRGSNMHQLAASGGP